MIGIVIIAVLLTVEYICIMSELHDIEKEIEFLAEVIEDGIERED